jgi:hypothetical protein
MDDLWTFVGGIDRVSGQIAAALHNAELRIYAALALAIILSLLLFPPMDDLDQA